MRRSNVRFGSLRRRLREIRERPGSEAQRGPSVAALELVVDEIIEENIDENVEENLEDPDADRLLFFDLETTGLAWGAQIFMAGYLFREHHGLRLVQEVASDVAEERLLVESALCRMSERPRLVTYNGSSFDLPLLRRRAAFHALPPVPELDHLDLLTRARRRYKGRVPDCRLSTIETCVMGKRRSERDVPGAEAPIRFLEFARSGDRRHLDPVLYHNRVDLTTLVALYSRLAGPGWCSVTEVP